MGHRPGIATDHDVSKLVILKTQSQKSSSGSYWELVRAANSRAPPQTYRTEALGVGGGGDLRFHKSSRGILLLPQVRKPMV